MRTESLSILQKARRINPHAPIAWLAAESDETGEAMVDVYGHVSSGGATAWDVNSWDAMLEELDNDPRTLCTFMDTPAVCALIRAQEASHVAA